MLTNEDLQAITAIVDASVDKKMDALAESFNAIIEAKFNPQFQLLAEGLQSIQERLIPSVRIEALEDRVTILEQALRATRAELEKMKAG